MARSGPTGKSPALHAARWHQQVTRQLSNVQRCPLRPASPVFSGLTIFAYGLVLILPVGAQRGRDCPANLTGLPTLSSAKQACCSRSSSWLPNVGHGKSERRVHVQGKQRLCVVGTGPAHHAAGGHQVHPHGSQLQGCQHPERAHQSGHVQRSPPYCAAAGNQLSLISPAGCLRHCIILWINRGHVSPQVCLSRTHKCSSYDS